MLATSLHPFFSFDIPGVRFPTSQGESCHISAFMRGRREALTIFFDGCQLKTGADIPIPIRETIVTIRVRHASISHVIVQVPEEKEKASPPFSQYHSINPIRGKPPLLCYADHSPRFPFGERREPIYQPRPERPSQRGEHDMPASATPWPRSPKRRSSLTPEVRASK